ncbi:hypothetical protein BJ742DRAFT_765799 [Cladochytrium replicatum]|nr:hypothetical protein BJ742DRAFT_765799 [Cladochytrium replicatum]
MNVDGWSVAANTLSAYVAVLGGGLAGISTACFMSKLSAEFAKAFGVVPSRLWSVSNNVKYFKVSLKKIQSMHHYFAHLLVHVLQDVTRGNCNLPCDGKRPFYGIWTYDNDDVYDTPVFPPKLAKLYESIVLAPFP